MKKIAFLALLGCISILSSLTSCKNDDDVSPKEEVPSDNQLSTTLDSIVNENFAPFMQVEKRPGLSLVVIQDGGNHYYNYGKNELGEIPTSTSLYEIASITKTFTATVIAALLQEEGVSINTPIHLLLPGDFNDLEFNNTKITLLHLLNHTSGLPRLPGDIFDFGTEETAYKNYDEEKILNYVNGYELDKEPGTVYEYSNLGYALISIIAAYQTEVSIAELIKDIITDPLNMTATDMELKDLDEVQAGQIMYPHNAKGDETYFWTWEDWQGMGGLFSTTKDMANYARAQFNSYNGPFKDAFQATHEETFDLGAISLGLGWHILDEEGTKVYNHNGGSSGFSSCILFEPEREVAIVAMINIIDEELFVPCITSFRELLQNQ